MCDFIILDTETSNPNTFYKTVKAKHYFSPKFKLNHKKYKNFNSGFWNLYAKEAKAISIRNEHVYEGFFKSVSEVTKITEKKISETMFELNPEKVVVVGDK